MTMLKSLMVAVGLVLAVAVPSVAQTALNSTTLAAAVSSNTAQQFQLASTSNVSAGDYLVIVTDGYAREIAVVRSVASPFVTVTRDAVGLPPEIRARTHASGATVYTGVRGRFNSYEVSGPCTRASITFLPHISTTSGIVSDCPTGTGTWVNLPRVRTVRSEAFNLDNGAATTIDAVLMRPTRAIRISACRIVYEDATTGTVAGGTAQVGTTVGGAQIVAATAYENTKAVGTTTAMVIVSGAVAAGTPVLVRHTGVAVTQAGEAVVECDYQFQ